ncbi:MAG: 6-carboxytetrahydropterin synthase QueD [Candidatus Improbicoccus devescovinae]|nr:MAG: 6-carboxytetrahydropterin synthase QueD [Candidatus Improbicoccus devescovinae]
MYTVVKKLVISAAHCLHLAHESICENLHGHNYVIIVYLRSETLDINGMVFDFTEIEEIINAKLDHKNLNDIFEKPTTENIAKYICDILGEKCFKVEVNESENDKVIYEK